MSFRYTEPMTWWMSMSQETPRTEPEALRVRDELARSGWPSHMRMARVSQTAAMFDASGTPAMLFRSEPWCQGAVWSLNPNPWLASTELLNAATVHWSDTIKERLYGATAQHQLDGEYLDSLEG